MLPMRILILEDTRADIDLLLRRLNKEFSESKVDVAMTVKEASQFMINNQEYDIGLFDIQLPDGNGLDLLTDIKSAQSTMPVIILTGTGDEEVAVAALKAGASDYVVKQIGYDSQIPDIIRYTLKNIDRQQAYKAYPIKVLYFEHHLADIDFTRRHLKRFAPHIKMQVVSSVKEGLKMLKCDDPEKCSFDLLLVDFRLPEMNALEIVKIVRQEHQSDIPIIIVTGEGNEETAIQALKLGADEYLVKRENYLFRLPSIISSAFQYRKLEKQKAELQKSEARYRLLADNSGDMIFMLDTNLFFTYISPAVKNLLGYEPKNIVNQSLEKTFTSDSLWNFKEIVSQLYSDRENFGSGNTRPIVFEAELTRKDRTTVWAETKVSLIIDKNEVPSGILGVARDISGRKHITDQLRKLSRAVEQSPVSIMITDTKGNIEYVNTKFTESTGYKREEVLGTNPRFLKSDHHSKDENNILWDTIVQGKDWYGEFLNKRKDGTLLWEQASISSLKDNQGKITHYIFVKEDITEKKKYEEELIQAKEKAEESNRLKTAFLHNISHEIRTPMNAITGFSTLITDPNLTNKKRIHYSDLIKKSSDHLLSVIADIINIATIEAGQEKLVENETDLNLLLQILFEQFEAKTRYKKLDFTYKKGLPDEQCHIITDGTKLTQILSNLINNSIKFTQTGHIKYGYRVENEKLLFYVEDTGIGISPEMYKKVFERFHQIDNTMTKKYEGMGLGLSIAKAYTEFMGGRIWLESKPGKGTVFYFTIPLIRMSKGDTTNTVEETKPGPELTRSLQILVAEDEEMNFSLIEEYLDQDNIRILRAKNGIEAVEICRSEPDLNLVLMDIKMPRMDGYEATKQILKICPDIPVIALTAYAQKDDRKKALDAGCVDYVSKPVTKETLFEVIRKILEDK